MLLGGTEEWEKLLVRSGFKAITAPFSCQTPRGETDAYCEITERHHVKIAEIGVWKNLLDPDREAAAAALTYAKGQLALAEERGIPCCVNIAGTAGRRSVCFPEARP